jgi:hypothetical protein
MPFGKYKGLPIDYLLLEHTTNPEFIELNKTLISPRDWSYFWWFHTNVTSYILGSDVIHAIEKCKSKCINEADEATSKWHQQQNSPEYNSTSKPERKSRNYSSMNQDYYEAGMSLYDMGYIGDGI